MMFFRQFSGAWDFESNGFMINSFMSRNRSSMTVFYDIFSGFSFNSYLVAKLRESSLTQQLIMDSKPRYSAQGEIIRELNSYFLLEWIRGALRVNFLKKIFSISFMHFIYISPLIFILFSLSKVFLKLAIDTVDSKSF